MIYYLKIYYLQIKEPVADEPYVIAVASLHCEERNNHNEYESNPVLYLTFNKNGCKITKK